MKKLSFNKLVIAWFVMQFLLLATSGVHNIGELIVGSLFLFSLVGFTFGKRRLRILSLFGLAVYSALSFICATAMVLLFSFRPYTTTIYGILFCVYLIAALVNLFLVFKSIKYDL